MQIKIVSSFVIPPAPAFQPGDILTVPDPVGRHWIEQKRAEEVQRPPAPAHPTPRAPETATHARREKAVKPRPEMR